MSFPVVAAMALAIAPIVPPAQTARATPAAGRPYSPVVIPNGWILSFRTNDGCKEFRLGPVVGEIAPAKKAQPWAYNGQSPGPTIEVAEGNRVRVFVTHPLPEHTSIHWHGQQLPSSMIGVDHREVVSRIARPIPGYMVMGERGMADLQEMEMPLPDNTLPMMAGRGPFGPLEMGGMFTVVKVRAGLARGDYRDPGPYEHPPGTVAYEWTGASLNPVRAPSSRATEIQPTTGRATGLREIEFRVRKPVAHPHR